MGRRLWFRECFTDHPLYTVLTKHNRPDEVWANGSQDKIRVYCTPCLEYDAGEIAEHQEVSLRMGEPIIPRGLDAIKLSLFNVPPTVVHGWLEARSDTLLSHLRGCIRQSGAVRDRAQAEIPGRSTGPDINITPRAVRTYSTASTSGNLYPAIVSPRPIPYYASQPLNIPPFEMQRPTSASPFETQYSVSFNSQGLPPIPPHLQPTYASEIPSRYNSPASSIGSFSSHSSRSGSPAESAYTNPPPKRARTTHGKRTLVRSSLADLSWDDERQNNFETFLARLTASAGFPLNWVSNPEFISFVHEFIPGATVPSRKSLTQRILPRLLKEVRADTQIRAKGKLVTLQCDGWTGQNNHHLVAFMGTGASELFTVQVLDTTTERKTAENLLAQMVTVIDTLEQQWGAVVIAFTTDASGESRKARRLLGTKFKHLVVPDCYAHQINLIVGDYFKAPSVNFLTHAATANELITWLRSKTAVLGLIRLELIKRGKAPLSVIRPVPTRWTAFYLAYCRILTLRRTLENIVEDDAAAPQLNRQIIQPAHERSARVKAEKMVNIIKDPFFWVSILRITRHLAPLAIAANVTQSAHCRLDEVLMTFGKLVMEYKKLTDPIEAPVQQALISSIERRWSKSDQDVFVAAVILNPFHKIQPFSPNPLLVSQGAVHDLFSRLWTRFYNMTTVPSKLYDETRDYLQGTGRFRYLDQTCLGLKNSAAGKNESPNPIRAYHDISVPGAEESPLIKLALHVLSICPNSASCERLFSTFGLILTKLRSRLGQSALLDLAELKMHIRDEHLRDNVKQHIRQRAFGTAQSTAPTVTASTGTTAPSQPPSQPAPSPILHHPLLNNNSDIIMGNPAGAESSLLPTQSATTSSTQALQQLTTSLVQLTEDDLQDSGEDQIPLTPGFNRIKESIAGLFDFTSAYWLTVEQRSAVGGLEAEMDFYDLLDLDAIGEPDLDPDLDDSVASLFDV